MLFIRLVRTYKSGLSSRVHAPARNRVPRLGGNGKYNGESISEAYSHGRTPPISNRRCCLVAQAGFSSAESLRGRAVETVVSNDKLTQFEWRGMTEKLANALS